MLEGLAFILLGAALFGAASVIKHRLISFTAQKPQDYADAGLSFDLKQHLNGPMICEGVLFGPTGRMTSSFTGDFNVTWSENTGVMREDFKYSNGDTQSREWELSLGHNGEFTATADDVPGVAKGSQSGPTVIFRYPLRLPDASGGHVLRAFDCMYVTDNGTIVNRSQFYKFGIKVAELVATIRKVEEAK